MEVRPVDDAADTPDVAELMDHQRESPVWPRSVIDEIQLKAQLGRYHIQGFSMRRSGVPTFDDLTFVPCTLSRVPLEVAGGGKVFAGLRSDPFFFDLAGFQGSVLGMGDRRFCDADKVDFFAELNANAIVLQVPDAALGRTIGVWAVTTTDGGERVDRMGRPAIYTVFNSGTD